MSAQVLLRRWTYFGALALAVAGGCTGAANGASTPAEHVETVERRIAGVWRLTGYVPEKDLSASLLLRLQSEKIVVRFDHGRVQSATEALEFDRRYRIADPADDTFKIFIEDDDGIKQESHCQFDENGNLSFEVVTEPWRGRGVLTREGAAFDQPVTE
jgi:hypothetical protein